MAGHVEQAFKDFHEFLSGTRAPALIGQSLATVVVQEQRTVAEAVAAWAYSPGHRDRFAALVSARNKVFDIFFYRVVRFRRIFDFFDAFEQQLVAAIADADRPYLERLLTESPWREIRPLGSFRDPLEYALDKRRRASAQRDKFNEDVYRNATHQLLSVDKRHTFEDDHTESLVARYQSQLAGVFDDFVDLIKDPQQRREILLANTADRHANYANRSKFDVANYVSHLMEFVIALVNDDYFEHGMQAFTVVLQIHKDFSLDVGSLHWQRFRAHCDLIDRQKLGEYSTDPSRAILLRSFLPVFEIWTPPKLLETILREGDRRSRRLAISLLAAYGSEVYDLVTRAAAACGPDTPWYFVRNLAYLLGRIVTGNEQLKARAVRALAPYLSVTSLRQLNLQIVQALGFIATPDAERALVAKLDEFSKHSANPDSAEVFHKILATLFAFGTETAVTVAAETCLERNFVARYRDEFARATLPLALRERLVARIRQETRKMKITGSLLGKPGAAREIIEAVGHSGYPEFDELCRSLVASFPAKHQLASESARLLATPPPAPLLATDRLLHGYLARADVAQALCHALDAGVTGQLLVTTREGVEGRIELAQGRVAAATVSNSLLEGERAVYLIALLDSREVASVRFGPISKPSTAAPLSPDLMRDVVFQRAEVRQIVDGIISPDSRFSRRDVHPIYTDFSRTESPEAYMSVWNALVSEVDLKAICLKSGLSRHDVFRILLYLHRRNMLAVDGARQDAGVARISDALATIEVYLRRIEQRPHQFRFYHIAADGCAFLERHASDATIGEAARVLGAYLLEAHGAHRAFVEENVDACRRTIELMNAFHRGGGSDDRQALADYVAFTFAAVTPERRTVTISERTLLEQLEDIAFTNDAFDAARFDDGGNAAATLLQSVCDALAKSGVSVESLDSGERPTPTEAKIVRELFGDVATAHTKPIKDLAREIGRARMSGRRVSSGWLRVIEPSVRLLATIAKTMHDEDAVTVFGHIERVLDEQATLAHRELAEPVCDLLDAAHRRLAEIAPLAFALELTNEQLEVKKSELLASFVLRQVEGVTDAVSDRLSAASLVTYEAFLDVVPDDIVVSAGIDPALAEQIFMKFYQYQDLAGRGGDSATTPKYADMFRIGLTTLKEACFELERIALDEVAHRDVDAKQKARLLAGRQRSLASLLALLCVRGQFDRIEAIQLSTFDKRVLLLDEYFAELAAHANAAA